MVQAYMGIDPGEPDLPPDAPPPSAEEEEAAIADFMAKFAAAGGSVH